ncbi:hypothetical protein [Nonomuraea pusilla]|uniref:4-amino-4-deoxy-L-arabinose transferase n=1 Tax=Nonomuraea pusilla TaxID=46177 RepID=A0A1H8HHB8_9ACTN|nr:hypothetical protein [Nonomuraea pusilla]SEN55671.1 hypothetical protein SAMN05660976_07810 [Nonomuraea pusilla]
MGGRDVLRSGWAPALVVVAGAVAVLHAYGVPPLRSALFGLHLAAAVALPGLLLWRMLRGRPGPIGLDVAAGVVLGSAVETLAYLVARWAGAPRAFLLWAAVVIAASVAVPGLRRSWRGPGPPSARVPVRWSWTVAAFAGLPVVWGASGFYRAHGLAWPGNAAPYVDMPYILAVAGEVRHHVPPGSPVVAGAPLDYHWFAFADVAATGWATGIELQTLLYRLWPLPLTAAFAVLLAFTARELTGRWWTGPAALAVTCLVAAPNPVGWTAHLLPSGAVLDGTIWVSPSQTFGTAVFALVVFLLAEVLRAEGRVRTGTWVALALLLVTVAGAKATYLPLLLAGLAVVIVTRRTAWAWRRGPRPRVRAEPRRPAWVAAALTAGCLAGAQAVLYGKATGLLTLEPLAAVQAAIDQAGLRPGTHAAGLTWAMAAALPASWALIWMGAAGALLRREPRSDPACRLLLGVGGAGACATLLLSHVAAGQFYFVQAARPCLALAAVWGVAAVIPARLPRLQRAVLVAAGLAGALSTQVIAAAGGSDAPATGDGAARLVALSYLALGCVLVAGAAGVAAAGRWFPALRGVTLPAAFVLAAGSGLPAAWPERALLAFEMWPMRGSAQIPDGAVRAARWLRGHSRPGDVVATNIPCTPRSAACRSRTFWLSAYSERRVLVEGWGYTTLGNLEARRLGVGLDTVPFWDRRRLADNAAAFLTPSPATIGRLRDAYGVRWLFVNDLSATRADPALGRYAVRRFLSGHCAVYEIPAGAPADVRGAGAGLVRLLPARPVQVALRPSGSRLASPWASRVLP